MIDWLADTLLATSVLMVIVLLIREPVRRQFGPAAAYGLWMIPALRLATPPLTWTVERSVPADAAVYGPLSTEPAQASLIPAAEPSLVAQLGGWEGLALSIWLAGAAAMLLGGFIIYRRQRHEVLRQSVQVDVRGRIRIVRSGAVRGPVAFGIVDPVIAIPTDFERRFGPNECRLALEHELSHHRSGDLAANHFAFACLCLQWFNPLAWACHSAFRLDQEAACDARVLDRVGDDCRADYVQAVAKAASGRSLLFAGALDRPAALKRRLRSMLTRQSTRRRTAGKTLVALGAATAMPLTASWATQYVDVPATASPSTARVPHAGAPSPHEAAALSQAAVSTTAAAAAADTSVRENGDGTVTLAGGVKLGKGSTAFFANDDVLINGKVKRLEQLTPAERTQLRGTILRSQRELARERADLPRELEELSREADRARSGALRREWMHDMEELRRDLAEIDAEAAELRAEGEDPVKRKAEILRDLREVEATDIAREEREAIAEADPRKVEAELRSEEAQMARMLAKLDQLDRR